MAKVVKRTFSLTEEQAAVIDEKVASGEYASGSEVVRSGLRAMQERDAAIEAWLREEVLPTMQRIEEDPSRLLTEEEAFARLEEHHEARLKAGHEGPKTRRRA